MVVVKQTLPVNLDGFIKFFREKYRLCWKEIYLKFRALVYAPEQCINCRQFFQISNIGGCQKDVYKKYDKCPEEVLPRLVFHELDFGGSELPIVNGFSALEYMMWKQEF